MGVSKIFYFSILLILFSSSGFAESFESSLSKITSGPPVALETKLGSKTYLTQTAKNITNAKVLWVNTNFLRMNKILDEEISTQKLNETILNEFAWGIPNPKETVGNFGNKEKIFFVDRYGGSGIGHNWGSGRAAESGRFQLKGIGKTDMVGLSQIDNHANGSVPIEEGIREVIWGEVNQDSPHGSNRVIALIDRGTITKLPNGTFQKDVIVVRESAIRPAHFLKALGDGSKFTDEKERIQQSSKFLLKALPESRIKSAVGLKELYQAGLQEYVDRVAEQYAFFYAHRLYHGGPSPSNIEISGRMIDYGTQTAQPGYGKVKILDHVEPSGLMTEIKETQIEEFIDGISKEYPKELVHFFPTKEQLSRRFDKVYQKSLRLEFLKLTGVSPGVVESIAEDSAFEKFSENLIKISKEGAVEFKGRYTAPEKVQKYELNRILKRLSQNPLNDQFVNQVLNEELPGLTKKFLRRELSRQYSNWIKASMEAAESIGIEKTAFISKLKENAAVLNEANPELYRWNAMDENFKIISEYEKNGNTQLINGLIEERIKKNKLLPADYSTPLHSKEASKFTIVEEGVKLGYGISPNEFRHDFFKPHLSGKKGILVSVGSFRTLNESGMGKFAKTILMDYDEKVSTFNSANLELIARNNNRRKYIAQLATGKHPVQWKKYYDGFGTDQDFIKEIQKYIQSPSYQFEMRNLKYTFPNSTVSKIEELVRDGTWKSSMLEMFTDKNQWGYSSVQRYFQNNTWDQTFFGSDHLFKKVQQDILQGNVHVINGNITSKKTSNYLSNFAKNINEKISVLDISNADSHLARGDFGKKQLKELSRFIRDLPLSSDSILLTTSKDPKVTLGYRGSSIQADHWSYFIHHPSEYASKLDTSLKSSQTGISALQSSLNINSTQNKIQIEFDKLLAKKIPSSKPTVILVTGPMGVGKSTMIEKLMADGNLLIDSWVIADPDAIKEHHTLYQRAANKLAVADSIHSDAAELNRLLIKQAIAQKKNLIVYASLANMESVEETLKLISNQNSNLNKVLVNVQAPLKTILKRNELRKLSGGHFVNPEKINYAYEEGPKNLRKIKKHFNVQIEIDNMDVPKIIGIEKMGSSKKTSLPLSAFNEAIQLDHLKPNRLITDPKLCISSFLGQLFHSVHAK